MIHLQNRWFISNNIGFKDGLRKPTSFSTEQSLTGEANKVAGQQPTKFAAWAKANFAIPAAT